jgi:hypothetical protein
VDERARFDVASAQEFPGVGYDRVCPCVPVRLPARHGRPGRSCPPYPAVAGTGWHGPAGRTAGRRRARGQPQSASRAAAIDGSWMSKPANVERTNASAMMIMDAPCPHPTSATLAPARSFSTTPSRAGSHSSTRWAAGRKSRKTPENSRSSCSCQPTRRRCETPPRTDRGRHRRRRCSRTRHRGDRAVLVGHHHRLLCRQLERAVHRVVDDVAAGRLVAEPARIALRYRYVPPAMTR